MIGIVVGETKDILGDYVVDIHSASKQGFVLPKTECQDLIKERYSMEALKKSLKEAIQLC